MKNSYILAKFIQDDEATEIFPGRVQYYFEHSIELLTSIMMHRLAFVRWYMYAKNQQTRFHCKVNIQNDKCCNIEL